jgi:hypothetical protein
MDMMISVAKRPIAPITERYRDGEFKSVETASDGVRRVAICDENGSHNRDYRVKYRTDPVVVIEAQSEEVSHSDLHQKLLTIGIWVEGLRKIERPTGQSDWIAGFASLPETARQIGWFKQRLEKASAQNSSPTREQNGAVVAPV